MWDILYGKDWMDMESMDWNLLRIWVKFYYIVLETVTQLGFFYTEFYNL